MGKKYLVNLADLSEGEKKEMQELGIIDGELTISDYKYPEVHKDRAPVERFAVGASGVLNEAFDYDKPSSFSRAIKLDLGDYRIMLISGTASVNEEGKAEHIGDFRAQTWRTYRNITSLLRAENMSWHDVIRTTIYLKEIDRDYEDFNKIRTTFFRWMGLDPLPASTGIQAKLCWDELLVEMEAIALCRRDSLG